jgi:transcriptional regulator with XRE-family HTH domain
MTTTGQRLRLLREQRGQSQEEIAKLIGVGRTTYLKYESGENKPTRKLKELATLFNVTSDYIMGFSDNPHGLPRVEQVEHFDELPLFDEPIPPDKPKDDDFDLLDYGNSNSCYNRSNDLMELGWELSSEEKQVLEAYDLLNEDEKRIVRYILATALERALEQEEADEAHQTGA